MDNVVINVQEVADMLVEVVANDMRIFCNVMSLVAWFVNNLAKMTNAVATCFTSV